MPNVELITRYLPDTYDQVYVQNAVSSILWQGAKDVQIQFTGARKVKVWETATSGNFNYKRIGTGAVNDLNPAKNEEYLGAGYRAGFGRGQTAGQWVEYELKYDRSIELPFDLADDEETAGLLLATSLKEHLRTKDIPEIDALAFGRLAEATSVSLGNRVEETGEIAEDTILGKINDAIVYEQMVGVPDNDIVIFVSPKVLGLLMSTKEITRFITQTDILSPRGINTRFLAYNGHPIVVVNNDRFYTDPVAGEGGYWPSATSKAINFMLVPLGAVVPVHKLDFSKIYDASETYIGGVGMLFTSRNYFDVIIPRLHRVGIYADISNESPAASIGVGLQVDLRKGTASGTTDVYGWYAHNGALGTLVYGTSAFVAGNAYTIGTGNTAVTGIGYTGAPDIGDKATVTIAGNTAYFAVINPQGKAIAVSGAIDITNLKGD